MKLNKKELQNISVRDSIIRQRRIELKMLETERELFVTDLLKNKGLDQSKKYSLSKDGKIIEV